jgi:hypothetical protein
MVKASSTDPAAKAKKQYIGRAANNHRIFRISALDLTYFPLLRPLDLPQTEDWCGF